MRAEEAENTSSGLMNATAGINSEAFAVTTPGLKPRLRSFSGMGVRSVTEVPRRARENGHAALVNIGTGNSETNRGRVRLMTSRHSDDEEQHRSHPLVHTKRSHLQVTSDYSSPGLQVPGKYPSW